MNLTKILSSIVTILSTTIIILLIYIYRENISKKIVNTVTEALRDDIIVPTETTYKRNYTFETVKETESFIPKDINDLKNIYYTVLNNGWESFTFYCPTDYEQCLDDTLQIANKSGYVEQLNFYVSPFNNFTTYNTTVSTNGEIFFTISKVYSKEEIDILNAYVDKVLTELKINTNNPTKNDLRNIHDYIIKNVTYDTEYVKDDKESNSNNAIGAVQDGKAICNGYTDLYALFLDRLKIKNMKLPSEEHIWNYVYFDGMWSHIDLTWDDDEINKDNTHNYFMINTKQLYKLDKDKHNFQKELFLEVKDA